MMDKPSVRDAFIETLIDDVACGGVNREFVEGLVSDFEKAVKLGRDEYHHKKLLASLKEQDMQYAEIILAIKRETVEACKKEVLSYFHGDDEFKDDNTLVAVCISAEELNERLEKLLEADDDAGN